MDKIEMKSAEHKNTKMVKVRALRDFTFATGKTVQARMPNGTFIDEPETKHVRAGDEVEIPESEVAGVTKVFAGGYAFGGERMGAEAKQRHALRRAEVVA